MPQALAETITHSPRESGDALAIRADALRAEAWAGEPFLRPDEDPDVVLAPGTARRRALDDGLAELAAGRDAPSTEWKVRYALLLGLERVLSEKPPHLASGTELRRHQVDALAGMLTELIAAAQKGENGNGHDEPEEEDEADDELELDLEVESEPEEDVEPPPIAADPGAIRRYRFRHPTASGKTIAASGFVEAARTEGVLILTHRRLLVDQFRRELTEHGYGSRFHDAVLTGHTAPRPSNPITIQTYAWFARHVDEIARDAYELVICDEAHTALGEKTSTAIRSLSEPIYIGMTATEELIAKQVSDVFPASVDDLPLADAARRGLIAPLRCLRVPPVAAINQVPIVGGDFEERALAQALDHEALNMAAATLYRERFGDTPGIVYAAGVDHAYNLATAFRAAGIKAEAVSGRTPPVKLAEILAAYERAEIDVLINAMLLAEGWNSPRATIVMHLAPTASKRVYQQRIGRIMRIHPRKEAGIVVDFTPKAATHNERVVSLHSLLDADFYREGARVTPAPRRRTQRRARRKLTPASWLVPVTPDVLRRKMVIAREWQRVDPKFLDEDEQEFWGEIAGRQLRFDERAAFVEKLTARGASKRAMEKFLSTCAAQNPNRRLRLIALADRVSMKVERADFDDLVTLVTQAPPWEKDRAAGVRTMLRAIADGKADAPGSDPRALDVEALARGAQAARPQGIAGVPGRETPARCARELARPPARGERGEARQRRARDAARGRRGAARLGRGLHAALDAAARGRARAARDDPGGRGLDRGEPAAAEDGPVARAPPAPAQEEDGHRGEWAARPRPRRGRRPARRGRRRGPAGPAKKRRRRRRKPRGGRTGPGSGAAETAPARCRHRPNRPCPPKTRRSSDTVRGLTPGHV